MQDAEVSWERVPAEQRWPRAGESVQQDALSGSLEPAHTSFQTYLRSHTQWKVRHCNYTEGQLFQKAGTALSGTPVMEHNSGRGVFSLLTHKPLLCLKESRPSLAFTGEMRVPSRGG